MPDPVREPNSITSFAPAITPTITPTIDPELHIPPSPRTHRLRKLQSAHNLGAAARNNAAGTNHGGAGGGQPSLITQQRLKDLQQLQEGSTSPTRGHQRASSSNRSPQRNRSNSDAPPPPLNLDPSSTNDTVTLRTKRSALALSRTSPAADAMSLERLVRDGPPDGDARGALESARLKVLDQGIRADSDGMVS